MDAAVDDAVDRAKAGDRDALAFLYHRYAREIELYVCRIVGDPHDAEDVTQHVFAKLITGLERYDRRDVPFSAWLYRLARNAAVDHLRRRRPPAPDAGAHAGERDDETRVDRRRCLRDALAALPGEQRDVVVLRHLIGLTPGEIAQRLGRSESSVHGLHHRGRRALRAELLRHDFSPSTLTARRAA